MKKVKCTICHTKRAKRKCKKNGSMICSLCCASIREERACVKCSHFKTAQNYNDSKTGKKKHFIIAIDEEVEKSVDEALILVEKGKITAARKCLNKLYCDHPQNHLVNYGLGVSYAFEGNEEKALHYFSKAVEIFPYFVEAYFNLAMAYKNKLDIKNAVFCLTKVCEYGDSKDELTQNAKRFLNDIEQQIYKIYQISLDKYFEAQELFEKSYDKMVEKKWEIAKNGFIQVLKIIPNHTQSLGNLGLCYGYLGEKKKALKTLEKALSIDPYYEPAIINKRAIELINEGETITAEKIASVDYYKESSKQKRNSIFIDTIKKIICK